MVTINNTNNTLLSGSDDADLIVSSGSNVTIETHYGDDVVSLAGSNQRIEYEIGNDTVFGLGDNDTINGWFDGSWTGSVSGNDVVLYNVDYEETGQYNSLTLKNAAQKKITLSSYETLLVPPAGLTLTGAGNFDRIDNFFDNVTVDAGAVKNALNVSSKGKSNFVVKTGSGNDNFSNRGTTDITIDAGDGNNEIIFSYDDVTPSDNISVKTGNGSDTIRAHQSTNFTVNSGAGEDLIDISYYDENHIAKFNALVEGGAGNDTITNGVYLTTALTIDGGDGNDSITNNSAFPSIVGGSGADYIYNEGGNGTIEGGDGNDSIISAPFSIVNGGNGDDMITIDNYDYGASMIEYANGDGNDTIKGYSGTLIHLTSGSISSASFNADKNLIFKIGTGSITVKDFSHPIVIKDPANTFFVCYVDWETNELKKLGAASRNVDDTLLNGVSDTILTLGEYDTDGNQHSIINNYGDNVTLNIVEDEEGSIYNLNNYGSHVTLNVDDDVLFISNLFNSDVVINVNNYVEHLYSNGSNVTINASEEGSARIDLDGDNQVVNYTGGNYTITGIEASDKIKIDGAYSTMLGDVYEVYINNGFAIERQNVIINTGSGSIALVDAKDVALNISDISFVEEADSLSNGITYDPQKPSKITVTDPFRGLVDAANFSDKVTMIDASADSNPVILKGGDKSTSLMAGIGGSTLIGGKANDKFYGGNGVDVFTYTVKASGQDNFYDVGANDIVSISGATRDQLKFVDKKETVTISFDNDSKSKITVSKVNSADPLTLDLDGETFTYGALPTGVTLDSNDKKTAIKVGASAADGVLVNAIDIVSTAKTLDGSAASGAVHLIGNDNANVITAGAHGSTLYGGHSTKAVADKLIGGKGEDIFVYAVNDGADQINNYSAADGDIISIVGDVSIDKNSFKESGKNVALTVGSQKLTINDVQYKPIVVVNGGDTVTFGSLAGGLEYNDKRTALLIGDPYDGTVAADDYAASVVTLDASNNTDSVALIGNKKAKVLVGGAGSTTLLGSTVNDVLNGGSGADTFVYSIGGGKDQIIDFDNVKDKIKILGTDTLTAGNIAEKGNDIILTVGKGTITLKDAPRGAITIEQDGGKTLTYAPLASGLSYDNKKVKVTADKNFSGVIDGYASTVEEITAANATDTVSIVGNDRNNVLRASKGGSTLDGGTGNDTLFGGAGADFFVYNGGNDLITGYSAAQDDVIDLQTAVTGSSIKGSDVILKFGNEALTIKGGLNNEIDMIDVNGNESSYMFTSSATYKLTKLNADLTDAAGGGAQLLTEDYWFEQSALENDPLEEVSAIKDVSLDLSAEFKDAFNRSTLELASAARHRRK